MNNEKITTENISFPEVEKLLAETRSEQIESAKRDGKYAGLKNLPDLKDESCAAHIIPFKTQVEQKRSQSLTILQPDLHIEAIKVIDARHKAETGEILARVTELEHLNDVGRRELDGKSAPQPAKSNLKGWVLSVLNGITDMAFNSAAFEALGDSLGAAIGIATGVAVGTFVLASGLVYCMRRALAGDRKWYVFAAIIALLAIGGFWTLSDFRTQQMAANGITGASPLSFLLLNLFFFAGAVIIAALYFPKDNQAEADRNLAERFAKIKEREGEISVLKKKIEQINAAAAQERRKHLSILSYATHCMNRFRSIYLEAVATWKSTNLLSRPDRGMPASFSEVVPEPDPLQFDIPPSLNLPIT